MRINNRWIIAVAGIFMQIALGAVYAWSVFRTPLANQFGWTISEVTLTFTISIFVLGIAAFFGGLWLNRKGPRVVAISGGVLYGLGVFLASFSASKLWWLYLSYGLIGGLGLGFAYIVPVAVLVKWFPDRRGLITGIAVGGFGLGALITAPVATYLIQSVGVLDTFAYLGAAFLVVTVITGLFMQDPPAGWRPGGWTPSAAQSIAMCRRRLHAVRRAAHMAMVRVMVAAFSEHVCGHFGHLARGADFSGTGWCDCGSRCEHGWCCQYRQRRRQSVLGLGF